MAERPPGERREEDRDIKISDRAQPGAGDAAAADEEGGADATATITAMAPRRPRPARIATRSRSSRSAADHGRDTSARPVATSSMCTKVARLPIHNIRPDGDHDHARSRRRRSHQVSVEPGRGQRPRSPPGDGGRPPAALGQVPRRLARIDREATNPSVSQRSKRKESSRFVCSKASRARLDRGGLGRGRARAHRCGRDYPKSRPAPVSQRRRLRMIGAWIVPHIHRRLARCRSPAPSASTVACSASEVERGVDGRVRSVWVSVGDAVLMLEREIKSPARRTGPAASSWPCPTSRRGGRGWRAGWPSPTARRRRSTSSTPTDTASGLSVFDFGG